MAKVADFEEPSPGLPYYPIDRHGNPVAPGRSMEDPPPYTEVDPTEAVAHTQSNTRAFVSKATNVFRSRGSISTAPETTDSSIPIVRGVPLASKSIDVVCPHCQADIRTSVEKRPGVLAYMSGAVLACFCWCCCLCLVPLCLDGCMEVKHTCPNCDGLIGKYRL